MSGTTATYDALDWSVDNCPIGRAMEILGERWTVVVLREVFSGIRRTPYREPGARQRYEYRLTEKGLDLYPLLIAIRDWGDRYLAGAEGSPLTIEHRDCGATVHTEIRCESGHPGGVLNCLNSSSPSAGSSLATARRDGSPGAGIP